MAYNQQTRYPFNGLTSEQFFVLLIQAAKSLNWKMGNMENKYSLKVPLSPESDSEELLVGIEDGAAVIGQNSKGFRLGRTKNNGNVMVLTAKLNEMRTVHPPDRLTEQYLALVAQKEAYEKDIEERTKANKLTPLEKIWLAKGTHYVTYSIIGINLLIYMAMVIKSGQFWDFSSAGNLLVDWGGMVRYLTTGGEWYRLITCMFLHEGLLHVAFNMWALFNVGVYLEPLLGRWRYLAVYLACGVFASLASTWWHTGEEVGIGASGAIFGMFGVFLALLTTNFVEKKVRRPMLSNIVFFVVVNLALGSFGNIDNVAHIGGLISGMLFGYLYYYVFISRKDNIAASIFITVALTAAGVYFLLPAIKDDTKRFMGVMERLSALDERAAKTVQVSDSAHSINISGQLSTVSLPGWCACNKMLDSTDNYVIPAYFKNRRAVLRQYLSMQITYTRLLIKRDSLASGLLDDSINTVRKKVAAIIDSLNKQ